jgi:hypothetical protein
MVIIDGKGIIQKIHLGLANEQQCATEIDKLLRGENLFTPRP